MFKHRKPSEVLMRYVDGTGGRFELDDVISRGKYDQYNDQFMKPLMEISEKYRGESYAVGLSNPDSFEEIRALAEKLQSSGL